MLHSMLHSIGMWNIQVVILSNWISLRKIRLSWTMLILLIVVKFKLEIHPNTVRRTEANRYHYKSVHNSFRINQHWTSIDWIFRLGAQGQNHYRRCHDIIFACSDIGLFSCYSTILETEDRCINSGTDWYITCAYGPYF